MTRVTPPAKHGTIQQYRRELAAHRAGTGPAPCDPCRAENSRRAREARSNREAKARRAQISVLPDVTPGVTQDVTPPPAPPAPPSKPRRTIGEMERAVSADLSSIEAALRVPFHSSLETLARQIAREIDEVATTPTVRRDARRQLFEVLKSLRTQKEGGDGSALDILLEQAGFGSPLVP